MQNSFGETTTVSSFCLPLQLRNYSVCDDLSASVLKLDWLQEQGWYVGCHCCQPTPSFEKLVPDKVQFDWDENPEQGESTFC